VIGPKNVQGGVKLGNRGCGPYEKRGQVYIRGANPTFCGWGMGLRGGKLRGRGRACKEGYKLCTDHGQLPNTIKTRGRYKKKRNER